MNELAYGSGTIVDWLGKKSFFSILAGWWLAMPNEGGISALTYAYQCMGWYVGRRYWRMGECYGYWSSLFIIKKPGGRAGNRHLPDPGMPLRMLRRAL